MLSPYITAGIVSLSEIKQVILTHHNPRNSLKLIRQLSWRDYFQSVYLSMGDKIFDSIKRPQEFTLFDEIPTTVLEAKTGIKAVDSAITNFTKLAICTITNECGQLCWFVILLEQNGRLVQLGCIIIYSMEIWLPIHSSGNGWQKLFLLKNTLLIKKTSTNAVVAKISSLEQFWI